MKRLILVAITVLPFLANAQEKPLSPEEVKKENAATAIEEKEVAKEKSEAVKAIEEGKTIEVKKATTPVKNNTQKPPRPATNTPQIKSNETEKALTPEQVKRENAATAIEEKEVAREKTEAQRALEQGREIVVQDSSAIYTSASVADNSGFARTVGFDGVWKINLNLASNELSINGGALKNQSDKSSNNLRLMVYYADKPFDVKNPELVGTVFSSIDVAPLTANETENNASFVAPVVLETPPAAGTYYPYILLGELNLETNEYEVKDVKVFTQPVTIP